MELSPKQVVAELDKYIIGQADAKKAVAVALRNRYRRSMLPDDIREEIKHNHERTYGRGQNRNSAQTRKAR